VITDYNLKPLTYKKILWIRSKKILLSATQRRIFDITNNHIKEQNEEKVLCDQVGVLKKVVIQIRKELSSQNKDLNEVDGK
jgi:hypothetical protein